jgi:hypothetical protein
MYTNIYNMHEISFIKSDTVFLKRAFIWYCDVNIFHIAFKKITLKNIGFILLFKLE